MKTRLLLLVLLVTFCALPSTAAAAQRLVLFETFTNTACGYCVANEPAVDAAAANLGPGLVLSLKYHVNWPSATDPFYLAAPGVLGGRRTYYGITGVPTNLCDGAGAPVSNQTSIEAAIESRLDVASPFEFTVGTSMAADLMTIDVSVTAVDDVPATGLALRMAIVEPYEYYENVGGNGIQDFYASVRAMPGGHAGSTLTITNGQTVAFQETKTIEADWDDVYVVVWVQDDTTKEVMGAASDFDYAFAFRQEEMVAVLDRGTLHSFNSTVYNAGTASDTYDLHIEKNMPANWAASVCVDGECLAPFITDETFTVAAGETTDLLVDMTPLIDAGSGTVTLTVTSRNDPTLSWSRVFTAISDGVEVVLIDDDGGERHHTYFMRALNNITEPYSYVVWDMYNWGKLSLADMQKFDIVIWATGLALPSLDATDRATLGAYLDAGGPAMISGQDIGWDLCDPAGTQHSGPVSNWFEDYFGATYVNDDVAAMVVYGIDGDPISDGMAFSIVGQGGANNQGAPDEIEPEGNGTAFLEYSSGVEAGVRIEGGGYRAVYLGFGFEGLDSPDTRNPLMQNILDWLSDSTSAVPGDRIVDSHLVGTPFNVPNPFNPETEIRFVVGGSDASSVKVAVYDLAGRMVRSLLDESRRPGSQRVSWDGRDDSGRSMASGVYVARVQVGDEQQSFKLTVTK